MLSRDNLDDQSYGAIAEKARLSISQYFRGWTDLNEHDPGIMLIELFAWLKEMQQFYMNQSVNIAALLPLLGVIPRGVSPARVTVRMPADSSEPPCYIPKGTPIMAEDIRFEIDSGLIFGGNRIELIKTCDGEWQEPPIFPFGTEPEAGRQFSLFFTAAFEPGHIHTLEVFVSGAGLERNPVDPGFPPGLAMVEWEYRTEDGYKRLRVCDGTYGFIAGGLITLSIDEPMVCDSFGRYELRCTLLSHEYDLVPHITVLRNGVFRAEQRYTLCEDVACGLDGKVFTPGTYLSEFGDTMLFCESGGLYRRITGFVKTAFEDRPAKFEIDGDTILSGGCVHALNCSMEALPLRMLGVADGLSRQRFKAETKGSKILAGSFSLLIGDDYEMSAARRWEPVPNLHMSSPSDLHFVLDEMTGEIIFGDGIHGALPKGVVMISSMQLSEGEGGNIAARQLSRLECFGRVFALEQEEAAVFGKEMESAGEAVERCAARKERAVTAEDFESLVMATPGLIIQGAAAFEDEKHPGCVTIAIKPCADGAVLSRVYQNHIRAYLEPYRLAGNDIRIVPPEYVRIGILAEVRPAPHRRSLIPEICGHLRKFFSANFSGFGPKIHKAELMGFLASLPEVGSVAALEMRTLSAYGRIDGHGNLSLSPNALAYLGEIDILFI